MSDPTGEPRPDREALRALIRDVIEDCLIDPSYRDADIEVDALMPAVLALLPAPHPQGGTEIRDMEIERNMLRTSLRDVLAEAERLRALLAAAPAPTDEVHWPFTDDGVTYCGWDRHEGCGEVWPCSNVRAAAPAPTEAGSE